ncbi:heparinase II/III family protein [Flavivirga jejuensis]|uniref:Heparinase II/III family protein n=1 Tax=Flavivirga jejuensis TaxID=870487 RepID=A0ABT8WJX5_9FLAO|nr:heparinase II/III family protein [Flavivirga jejuensis]MDO5973428.1 heparinase II/III family protein [Flavivirga jejuensis]
MKNSRKLFFLGLLFVLQNVFSQEIPTTTIISNEKLSNFLKVEVKDKFTSKGAITQADLAQYFREKFSKRYFYDWKTFDMRFKDYNSIYNQIEKNHEKRALDHISKYSDATQWKLPFNYLFGEPVNTYALRHLARQHKMVDVAFYYNYQDKNPKYLSYFTNQLKSLNVALEKGEYEKIENGNGIYEAFRSGYRILNWLQIHNMFLGEASYTDNDQLTTIATLLQHGAHLYANNTEFHSGNHQTRGLSALAMLSILLRDFQNTDAWYERSMRLLEEHLSKEINDDGFQFERTVHYHMSDIGNYYYVYQLAKLSGLEVNDFWKDKLKSLFITLTKVAYPDKSAPVLSDDTDQPWAETNDISGALTLGYLLFDSPKMGYFANNYVKANMYWYLSGSQLKMLEKVEATKPTMKSVEFPTTGYYIMREGWNDHDKMMIISNGLDDKKPDHQHGDMLGVQAMANGKVILPNYQVRYSLKDLELFKNSMTKNVALVDNELQGKQYTSNKGGSGFGKYRELPEPKTIAWKTDKDLDVFIGSHNGFENIDVAYSRQVIYVKDDFWIVKDNFKSNKKHTYKQVWQGHYSLEMTPNLIRSTFDNASGLDIYQLRKIDDVSNSGQRGKGWSVVSKKDQTNFSFITALYPYKGYSNRLDEDKENPDLKGWELHASKWKITGVQSVSITKDGADMFFSVKQLQLNNIKIEFSNISDAFLKLNHDKLVIQSLSDEVIQMSIKGVSEIRKYTIEPGNKIEATIKN